MRRFALGLLAAATAAGCDDGGLDPQLEAATEQAVLGVEGSLREAQFLEPFQPGAALASLSLDEARRRALTDVIETFELGVQRAACLGLDTDESSYVQLEFDECQVGLFGRFVIDGSIRGELELEVSPCGAEECLEAVVYQLVVDALEIRLWRDPRGLVIDGDWTYRASVEPGGQIRLVGETRYTGPLGNQLHIASDIAWHPDGVCVTLSGDSRIEALDDSDATLGSMAISSTGVERCGGQCPVAGTVFLAFGRGDVLTWTYTGDELVSVEAPGGQRLDVALACDPG
jgi:hypothetical protein